MYIYSSIYIYICVILNIFVEREGDFPTQYNTMFVDQRADWEADLKMSNLAWPPERNMP